MRRASDSNKKTLAELSVVLGDHPVESQWHLQTAMRSQTLDRTRGEVQLNRIDDRRTMARLPS